VTDDGHPAIDFQIGFTRRKTGERAVWYGRAINTTDATVSVQTIGFPSPGIYAEQVRTEAEAQASVIRRLRFSSQA
jgi:hypothetical protein